MQVALAVQSHAAGEYRTKTWTFISLTLKSRLLTAVLNHPTPRAEHPKAGGGFRGALKAFSMSLPLCHPIKSLAGT